MDNILCGVQQLILMLMTIKIKNLNKKSLKSIFFCWDLCEKSKNCNKFLNIEFTDIFFFLRINIQFLLSPWFFKANSLPFQLILVFRSCLPFKLVKTTVWSNSMVSSSCWAPWSLSWTVRCIGISKYTIWSEEIECNWPEQPVIKPNKLRQIVSAMNYISLTNVHHYLHDNEKCLNFQYLWIELSAV